MLKNFLTFDKLMGTSLIMILYYIGMVGIVLAGLGALFAGFQIGFMAIVSAIFGTLLALVFWRFMCELYILFFRMSDDLRDIKNHQLGRAPNKTEINID